MYNWFQKLIGNLANSQDISGVSDQSVISWNNKVVLIYVSTGDVIVLGASNVFRFNHPREAAELREKRKVNSCDFVWLKISVCKTL